MKSIKFLCIIFALSAGLLMNAQPPRRALPEEIVFSVSSPRNDLSGRVGFTAPTYLVYPDAKLSREQADRLTSELGLPSLQEEYGGTVMVVAPKGAAWNEAVDFEVYKNIIENLGAISNLKLIAIGNGATFVNKCVAPHAGMLAGIVTIGGKPSKIAAGSVPVPVYAAGKNAAKVAAAYKTLDGATLTSAEGRNTVYTNPEEELLRVVVNPDPNASLSAIVADSWDALLSRNYRYNNFGHTWYTGAKFEQYGAYELEPYPMFDRLGIERNVIQEDVMGNGEKFLWYEYIPKTVLGAPKASVPLVVLLHGHGNDPRTQSETSGFVELAAKENFAVVEMEWEGNGQPQMGYNGIEETIYFLLKKYPQIDPSRIYAEGLSAGSATATGLGIKKSYIFAAVGGHSAGIIPGMKHLGHSAESLINDATQKSGKILMPYFSVTGTNDGVWFHEPNPAEQNSVWVAWKTYATLNGIPFPEKADFSAYPLFGVNLRDRGQVKTNKGEGIVVEYGRLYKDNMPLIQANAIIDYGHWNFKPAADMMWEFFKLWSRDPKTKELKYHPAN